MLIAVAPRMDRHHLLWTVSYQVCSPNPSHPVVRRGTKSRIGSFDARTTRAMFERFRFPPGSNLPIVIDRNGRGRVSGERQNPIPRR
jgi:hypothetical protein